MQYRNDKLLRADTALLSFGLVQVSDQPLLCMTDLPPGYSVAEIKDPSYDGTKPRLV